MNKGVLASFHDARHAEMLLLLQFIPPDGTQFLFDTRSADPLWDSDDDSLFSDAAP